MLLLLTLLLLLMPLLLTLLLLLLFLLLTLLLQMDLLVLLMHCALAAADPAVTAATSTGEARQVGLHRPCSRRHPGGCGQWLGEDCPSPAGSGVVIAIIYLSKGERRKEIRPKAWIEKPSQRRKA